MAKHPAFDEEQQALADNLKLIDELVALLKAGSDAGADREAKSAIAKLNAPDIDTLKTERPKPYFGRLKLNDPEYGPLDLYIGKVQIPDMHADVRVMSWTSAMAATWYKTSLAAAKVSLDRPKTKTLPKRKAVVEVNGRRLIAIEGAKLVEVNDSFWTAESGSPQVAPAAGDSASDQFLTKVLERDRSDSFEDIVPTITPDQYELIADDKGGPRVIDGVPGSGKTTVAFHRLSYLVSGEREVGKRLNSNRVLALGPSPLFVLWSGSIRSSLQLDSVNYFTVEDWMWRWLAAQKIELGALTGTEPDQETYT
jgi:DNA helicase-2/ATP-dependent DNA helicase PcrA